jgi:hypothetical protein
VTTSVVVVVVVFALFVRSLSLSMGFALLFVLFSVSVRGVRSVELVQYLYRLGFWLVFDPIYTSLHPSLIDRHLPSFRELVCEASSLDRLPTLSVLSLASPSGLPSSLSRPHRLHVLASEAPTRTIPRRHRVTADHSFSGTTPGGATPGPPSACIWRPRASSRPLTTLDVLEVPRFWNVEE